MRIFPKLDMNFVRRQVLILAVLAQLSPLIIMLSQVGYEKYIQPRIIKATYVANIYGDPTERAMIKDALDYFNSFDEDKIIIFEKPGTYFDRAMTFEIHDFSKDLFLSNLAGLTSINEKGCKIQVYPTSDPIEFRQVLIHEYLHCMGYNHVDNTKDIMYKSYIEVKEDNIQKYADELKAKLE